jgi:hypothetical protein
MQHHFDCCSDSDTFCDCADWNRASYTPDLLAELGEPIPDAPNGYRQAALAFLHVMATIDGFILAGSDTRVALVVVAIALRWPSVRGLSIDNIANQLGCTPAALTRSIARFKTMAGLNSAGGVRFIRPGAGLNGDKPAAVRA